MREITLTQGRVALVDDEDYELVKGYSWYASSRKDRSGHPICYAETRAFGTIKGMHRIILGDPDDKHIDHINDNGLDNRRSNLRLCSLQQNIWNSRKRKAVCSSQYKGVAWDTQTDKWRAKIRKDGKTIHLGRFSTEEEAAAAYDEAAKELFGEFARLNLS